MKETENELTDNKKLFLVVVSSAAAQAFFMLVLGSLIVFKKTEWVLLACLLVFSLVNLAFTLSIGTIVTRIVESLKRQSISVRRVEDTLRKMLRGPRPDGLMEVDEAPVPSSPEAVHKDMMRRFGA